MTPAATESAGTQIAIVARSGKGSAARSKAAAAAAVTVSSTTTANLTGAAVAASTVGVASLCARVINDDKNWGTERRGGLLTEDRTETRAEVVQGIEPSGGCSAKIRLDGDEGDAQQKPRSASLQSNSLFSAQRAKDIKEIKDPIEDSRFK